MTEQELRQKVVNTAVGYHGRKESDGSHKPIIDLYNKIKPLPAGYKMSYTDPWCAAFVSAVAQSCGLTDIIPPECSCDRQIALFKKAGRWQENDSYAPQAGDVIYYDWNDSGEGDNAGSADHVGIVVSVGTKNIKVIEGNISDSVGYRTIAIGGKFIRGFGLPDYAGKASGTTSAPAQSQTTATTPKEKTCTVELPQLSKGSEGEAVTSLQVQLLHRWEYDPNGIDTEFGAGTRAAVIKFQKARGLEADGIVGPATWAALLRG